jgi:hypothetical protein
VSYMRRKVKKDNFAVLSIIDKIILNMGGEAVENK